MPFPAKLLYFSSFFSLLLMPHHTVEHQAYEYLQLWEPVARILPPEGLMNPLDPLFPLFSCLYKEVQHLYTHVPRRKNGDRSFLHPINLVLTLKRAKIENSITLCTGLIHDIIEEKVDLNLQKHSFREDKMRLAEHYETEAFQSLEKKITHCCQVHKLSLSPTTKIIKLLKLLTRHKRHFYYKSMSGIFDTSNAPIKEAAIQIKLADRMHNIQCLDCFNEEEQIYQCFKNLFILNNAKKYLLQRYGKKVFAHTHFSSTARLFNKCARATYDAFLAICHSSARRGKLAPIRPMLQLAFKKFALEMGGLWVITEADEKQAHPFRLYQGIVRKYDARLHHEWEKFEQLKKEEMEYCQRFFSDYGFSQPQLQAIMDYKDAYSLKEVVAYLLYQPEYVVHGFLCSELSTRKRIKN